MPKDKEKFQKYQKEWREKNKEKVKEYDRKSCKKYYLKNREEILRKRRINHLKIKDNENERSKKYHSLNRDKISKRKKNYAQLDYVKERNNERQRGYRKNNPLFVIKNSIRDKTKHTFKLEGNLCKECGDNAQVRHHPSPYKFDNFMFLCNDCHIKLHRRLNSCPATSMVIS